MKKIPQMSVGAYNNRINILRIDTPHYVTYSIQMMQNNSNTYQVANELLSESLVAK